jgi:F-type H+-transporting ATPase subunit a
LVSAILIAASVAATRNLQVAPRGLHNFMEVILEIFLNLLDEVIGHDGRRYLPLIATLGLFILASNLLGLVPGLVAPKANMYKTIACAVIVFCYYHYLGIRKQASSATEAFLRPAGLAPLMFPSRW